MSNTLTAQDIRIILLELDLAETYRELPNTHAKSIRAIRDMLLRAALADVEVEPVEQERAV
jgi:hypothetical protein